jgi:uncharacterized membrane protein
LLKLALKRAFFDEIQSVFSIKKMANRFFPTPNKNPRFLYRGESPNRLDGLTDAVFGIAITLLIFNLTNPNSFSDLVSFTKTLPAFLISISFLMIVWREHVNFSALYGLHDSKVIALNVLYIALVIFYVYPLRFWTLFLTNLIFQTDLQLQIQGDQVPDLMVFYGFVAFGLYFTMLLLYLRVRRIHTKLQLNADEVLHTRLQVWRMVIMSGVPLLSILVIFLLRGWSAAGASFFGGLTYMLYTPLMIFWSKKYQSLLEGPIVHPTDFEDTSHTP